MSDEAILEGVSPETFPRFLALFNPIAKVAYAMRRYKVEGLSASKPFSEADKTDRRGDPFVVLDHRFETPVCDACFLRSFRVGLSGVVSKIWKATLSFSIDGEILVRDLSIQDAIDQREVVLPKVQDPPLFTALLLKGDGRADRKSHAGYMLPNGGVVQVTLSGIPLSERREESEIKISCNVGYYTTKPEPADSATRLGLL